MIESVVVNLFCFISLAIIAFGMNLQKGGMDKVAKRFVTICIVTACAIIVNVVAEVCEGRPQYSIVLFISNLLTFISVDLIVISFIFYFSALVGDVPLKKKTPCFIALGLSIVRIFVVFFLSLKGFIFEIVDGKYVEKPLDYIPYVMSFVIMLCLIVAAFINKKSFTNKQFAVILLYLVAPIIPIACEIYLDIYSITFMAIKLSLFLVYVLIQTDRIDDAIIRERVLHEISVTDFLSGLNNRRAYYDKIASLKPGEDIGVLFCDINGLKKANDSIGHIAGDELIKKFAEVLKSFFSLEELYRISGDEFIVIIRNNSIDEFYKKAEDFRRLVFEHDSIASFGFAYGKANEVEKLVAYAEKLMYENKEFYYQTHPKTTIEQ